MPQQHAVRVDGLRIGSADRTGAILICDSDNNDVAEFFHNEHATVGQSYETALRYAEALVAEPDLFEINQALRAALKELRRIRDRDVSECRVAESLVTNDIVKLVKAALKSTGAE